MLRTNVWAGAALAVVLGGLSVPSIAAQGYEGSPGYSGPPDEGAYADRAHGEGAYGGGADADEDCDAQADACAGDNCQGDDCDAYDSASGYGPADQCDDDRCAGVRGDDERGGVWSGRDGEDHDDADIDDEVR